MNNNKIKHKKLLGNPLKLHCTIHIFIHYYTYHIVTPELLCPMLYELKKELVQYNSGDTLCNINVER